MTANHLWVSGIILFSSFHDFHGRSFSSLPTQMNLILGHFRFIFLDLHDHDLGRNMIFNDN